MPSQKIMNGYSRYIVSGLFSLIFLSTIFLIPYESYGGADSPEQALRLYMQAMKEHNNDPELSIYTEETKQMLRTWKTTASQMDNMVRTYGGCTTDETKYDSSFHYAVIRYSIEQRRCSPWFFEKVGGNWKLDLTMMQKAVRFDNQNRWRLLPGASHNYEFAFSDWSFDSNGYPQASIY